MLNTKIWDNLEKLKTYKDAFITWNTKYVPPAMGSNTSGTDTVKSQPRDHQAIISLNINLPNNDYSLHPQITLLNL